MNAAQQTKPTLVPGSGEFVKKPKVVWSSRNSGVRKTGPDTNVRLEELLLKASLAEAELQLLSVRIERIEESRRLFERLSGQK